MHRKKKIKSGKGKKSLTYKGIVTRITPDFSIETLKADLIQTL